MTDQPKPNQPTNPPVPAQPVPNEASSAADKAPTSPPTEPKASSLPNESKPDTTTKPAAADAKPEAKPDAAPAANSAPTKPTNTESPAAVNAEPAKPASSDSSAPQAAQPPKPANTDSSPAQAAEPAKPASSETQPAQTAQPPKPESGETSKPQPASVPDAAPASASSPTEKRDISEDPTMPGKPAVTDTTAKPAPAPLPSSTTMPIPPLSSILGDKDDTIPPLGSSTKVTQRFTEPSQIGPASAGTICPSCGHRNRPGTLICDNCGTNLMSGGKSTVGTRDLVAATEAAAASEPLMNVAQLHAVESAGGSVFSDDMVLRIEIEGGATPMLVYPKQEIILGRRDPNTGTLPDVDMTAYSGYRMGVSRTHASIHLQDKQLNLSDRGSSNGTFLNGTRLVAHRPYPIKDGDEIRLGQMVLKIYFQSNKTRK